MSAFILHRFTEELLLDMLQVAAYAVFTAGLYSREAVFRFEVFLVPSTHEEVLDDKNEPTNFEI